MDACLDIIASYDDLAFWALENPIGRLRRLRWDRLGNPALIFNPCDYGDPYTKRTQLWGNFNRPKLDPVEPQYKTLKGGKRQAFNYGWKSAEERSITPPGFARAFFEANP